jgi:hypothetical protein
MFKSMPRRSRVLAFLAMAAIAASALFATGGEAHANTTSEMYLNYTPGWCVTIPNFNVGSQLILGDCNDSAASQKFHAANLSGGGFEIVSDDSGLCVTYNYPNGHADGGAMVQGVCAGAQTQIFDSEQPGTGGFMYYLPERVDNNGYSVTFDNKNAVLAAYNPQVGSYYCLTCDSERWSELYT